MFQIDSDDDGINDYEDRCQGFDDKVDNNSNQIPDGCEEVSEVTEEENLEKTNKLISPLNVSIAVFSLILFGLLLRRKEG